MLHIMSWKGKGRKLVRARCPGTETFKVKPLVHSCWHTKVQKYWPTCPESSLFLPGTCCYLLTKIPSMKDNSGMASLSCSLATLTNISFLLSRRSPTSEQSQYINIIAWSCNMKIVLIRVTVHGVGYR